MKLLNNLLREIQHRSLWKVVGVYVLVSLGVIEGVDTLVEAAGLPSWFPAFALALLLIGLPVVVATALVQAGPGADRGGAGAGEGDVPSGGAPGPAGAAREAGRGGAGARVAGIAPAGAGLHRLLTWRNAVGGGIVAFALWGVVAAGWMILVGRPVGDDGAEAPTVAVLPFGNLSDDPGADAFVLGVHDDILTQLSKIGALRVISRTSVMEYRDSPKNLRQIAEELGASVVLEGGIQRSGSRVRVNAQLIDAETDAHLWAESYDEELTPENIFAIQSRLARSIADALDATLSPEEERRIEKRPTESLAAYDLLLRGRELYAAGVQENETAVELFRRAIALDPDFADAYAELANAYGQRVQTYGYPREWADSGRVLARRSIELDPELAVGYKALGLSYDQLGWYREAEEAYLRALEIEPSYGVPMLNLAATAGFRGECDTQLRWARRAEPLMPRSPYPPLHVSAANICLGRVDEAERWLDRTEEISPGFIWAVLGRVLLGLSLEEDAAARGRVEALLEREPRNVVGLFLAGVVGVSSGDQAYARETMETLLATAPEWGFRSAPVTMRSVLAWALREEGGDDGRVGRLLAEAEERARSALDAGVEDPSYPMDLAAVHALRGETAAALEWLERAYEAGWWDHRFLRRDARFEAVAGEPRFQAVLDSVAARGARQRTRVEAGEEVRSR